MNSAPLFVVSVCLSISPLASAQDASTDEPEVERGLVLNAEGATPGYTLFAPLRSDNVILIDLEGNEVHRWKTGLPPAGGVYLLESGNLLTAGRPAQNPRFNGGGIGGVLQEFSWDGELLWEYTLADDYQTMHHDLEPLPNGNVLAIVWEHRFPEDALAAGRDPATVGEKGLWPDAILEIEPVRPGDAKIVWEWHAWDHLIQDFDPEGDSYGDVAANPGKIDVNADHRDQPPVSEKERKRLAELEKQMRALGYVGDDDDDEEEGATSKNKGSDWLHTNAVDYHPELDLIVLSSPRMNEIWVIDHSTTTDEASWDSGGRFGKGGDLLWRWGNPRNYGRGADEDRRLFYQHDPKWVIGAGDADLRLTVYNNGGGRPDGNYSSVEELVLPFDPEHGFRRDEERPFGPTEPAWSYSKPGEFYSGFISGAQRLPSGNTLICSGAGGRVFEVTPAGEIVWEYLNPYLGDIAIGTGGDAPPTALFRATRIAADHPGLAGL